MNEKIYCKSGGCSAKLGAKKLSHILEKIDSYKDSNVLVGFDSRDDAAVYQIDENHAFVSTLDFFPPMVEDPYLYGQIAATNALQATMKSIIISACTFFGATFGVGAYSNIDMISSLCILMSRGAFISMFCVICILPAFFIIFDKFIIKGSYKFLEK